MASSRWAWPWSPKSCPKRRGPFAEPASGLVGDRQYLGGIHQHGPGPPGRKGVLGQFSPFGVTVTAWRVMFLIGHLPALLAVVIRRRSRNRALAAGFA